MLGVFFEKDLSCSSPYCKYLPDGRRLRNVSFESTFSAQLLSGNRVATRTQHAAKRGHVFCREKINGTPSRVCTQRRKRSLQLLGLASDLLVPTLLLRFVSGRRTPRQGTQAGLGRSKRSLAKYELCGIPLGPGAVLPLQLTHPCGSVVVR
jgi:hypothetical protein